MLAQTVYNDLTRGPSRVRPLPTRWRAGWPRSLSRSGHPVPYPSLTATTVHPPKGGPQGQEGQLAQESGPRARRSTPARSSPPPRRSPRARRSTPARSSPRATRSARREARPEARRPQEVATGRRGHVELDHSHNQGRAPDNAGGGGPVDFVPVVNGVHGPAHYTSQSALDDEASFAWGPAAQRRRSPPTTRAKSSFSPPPTKSPPTTRARRRPSRTSARVTSTTTSTTRPRPTTSRPMPTTSTTGPR